MKQGPFASGGAVPSTPSFATTTPSDFLSAAVPLPGVSGYRQASLPTTRRRRGRGGSPHFREQPSDRSEPTAPEGSSVPASGSLAPSVAFAVPIAARLPLGPPLDGVCMTTLVRPRNLARATDRPVVPPRFAPGLSTTHGGVPTGDPDVSPDQTYPGWLSQFARSRHVIRILLQTHRARADGHTMELHHPPYASIGLK